MAKFSFTEMVRKFKSAPNGNQKWAMISLLAMVGLLVWWIANFFA